MTSARIPKTAVSASPRPGPEDPVVAGLVEEMLERWKRGDFAQSEELLNRHPHLWQRPQQAIELIYEEICLRHEHGLAAASEDIFRRFPQWRPQLELMLECHRLLEVPSRTPCFPTVGDIVGEFHLLELLGSGAGGRVFLARQSALADRPVVVKITPLQGREYLNLARLQHTHIVPLYAVHDDYERNLRMLCMPFFGGTSLDRLLRTLAERPLAERTGERWLEALEGHGTQAAGPAPAILKRFSFVEAVCWTGACLAEALHYAHEGGLVHLDVKPSNVLIAADGQPMLLDFHLSRSPLRAGQTVPEGIGGTHGYMPPEQEQALAAVANGRPIPQTLDHRADVYSLAAVLYEALGGKLPFVSGESTPLHRQNRRVSAGLSDLLEKCLAPRADDRYTSAALLATDLRNHLNALPLRGVRNRSIAERLHKWQRRRPTALRTLALVGIMVGTLAVWTTGAVLHWEHRRQDAERDLLEGRKNWQEHRQYAESLEQLRHGLELARSLPLKSALVEQLQAEVERAQEAQAADQRRKTLRDLHEFLEEIRGLYGLDFPPPSRLASMDASLRAFWKERRPIQQWLEFSRSPEAARDLLDLALFAADWKVRMAQPGQRESACKHALTILDDAQELFGPGAVLHHARQRYRKELKLPPLDDSTAPAPKTAWEHTILGRSYLERGDLAMASQCLHQATERWPHGFWPNFYLGLCSHRQGRFAEAVSAFSVCIGSTPATASAFHNRALGYSALGRHDLALRDYAQALELNPKLSAAALNRGLLYLDARKYGEAEHDLERALSLGATPATVHFNLALVQVAQHKPDLARRHLRIVLSLNPEDTQARGLWNRLSAENGK